MVKCMRCSKRIGFREPRHRFVLENREILCCSNCKEELTKELVGDDFYGEEITPESLEKRGIPFRIIPEEGVLFYLDKDNLACRTWNKPVPNISATLPEPHNENLELVTAVNASFVSTMHQLSDMTKIMDKYGYLKEELRKEKETAKQKEKRNKL